MTSAAHSMLEAGRVQAAMSFDDLWLDYFGLGGTALPHELRSYLAGRRSEIDYDVVAHAINERFLDRGQDHPLPYADDLQQLGEP